MELLHSTPPNANWLHVVIVSSFDGGVLIDVTYINIYKYLYISIYIVYTYMMCIHIMYIYEIYCWGEF